MTLLTTWLVDLTLSKASGSTADQDTFISTRVLDPGCLEAGLCMKDFKNWSLKQILESKLKFFFATKESSEVIAEASNASYAIT